MLIAVQFSSHILIYFLYWNLVRRGTLCWTARKASCQAFYSIYRWSFKSWMRLSSSEEQEEALCLEMIFYTWIFWKAINVLNLLWLVLKAYLSFVIVVVVVVVVVETDLFVVKRTIVVLDIVGFSCKGLASFVNSDSGQISYCYCNRGCWISYCYCIIS
jgi:hypothetical protein